MRYTRYGGKHIAHHPEMRHFHVCSIGKLSPDSDLHDSILKRRTGDSCTQRFPQGCFVMPLAHDRRQLPNLLANLVLVCKLQQPLGVQDGPDGLTTKARYTPNKPTPAAAHMGKPELRKSLPLPESIVSRYEPGRELKVPQLQPETGCFVLCASGFKKGFQFNLEGVSSCRGLFTAISSWNGAADPLTCRVRASGTTTDPHRFAGVLWGFSTAHA